LPIGIRTFEAYELHAPGVPEVRHVGVRVKADDELRRLGDDLSRRGARICALSGHADLLDPDPAADAVRHLERCLEAAPLLGCPIVVTASGFLRGEPAAAWERLVAVLRHLGDVAGEEGVRLAVECHYGEFIATTEEAERLMEAVAHPRVGVNYDAWHFALAAEDLERSVRVLSPWIIHTHIHDVPRDCPEDTKWFEREEIPGRGVVDWSVILAELKRVGYGGALPIELHKVFEDRVRDHVQASKFLKAQLQRLGAA
jgi:sugar phosphate isomerase/epimerase